MSRALLREVAPASPAERKWKPTDRIWMLNLDQVESVSGRVLQKVTGTIAEASASTHAFDEERVLYCKLRPYLNKVVCPDEPGICTTELVPLRPDPTRLNRRYLTHYLRSPRFVSWASNAVAGAKMPRVSMRDFWKQEIPLPSLDEQKRIARILDAADALRAKRRESLAQLDTLLQSTFLDMFGDPVTNAKGWELRTIGDVGQVVTGNTPSRKHPEYYGDNVEWIKSDNINDPSFTLTPAREKLSTSGRQVARVVPAGSVLVTCIAGSRSCIGNVSVTDRAVAFNQQINAIVPGGRLEKWYAFAVIHFGKELVQRASTDGMKGMVSKSVFSSIRIPLPPLDLQRRFATVVDSVEQQKGRQRAHLAELDNLFASLQQRAFNGELSA